MVKKKPKKPVVELEPEPSEETIPEKEESEKSLSQVFNAKEVEEFTEQFEKALWEIPVEYAFCHPKVRSRLEMLMGTNVVRLTDRSYMQKLHSRIVEDYIQSMNKRIAAREALEREREKVLVLNGLIPLHEASPDLEGSQIFLINAYCEKIIAEKRARYKWPKATVPLYVYVDDVTIPAPDQSVYNGHVFRTGDHKLCERGVLLHTDEEDIENGYMYTDEEYEKKFVKDSPEIKELGNVTTVEELYTMADEILGPLKTIEGRK